MTLPPPPGPDDPPPPWWKWLIIAVASVACGAAVALAVLMARGACAAPVTSITDGSRAVIFAHVTAEQETGRACTP